MLVKPYKAEKNGKRMTIICTNGETLAQVKKSLENKLGKEARICK